MVDVEDWVLLLDIPRPVYDDIKHQHRDKATRVQGFCEWYLSHHPAPSWLHVADTLYCHGEHRLTSQVSHFKGYCMTGREAYVLLVTKATEIFFLVTLAANKVKNEKARY